MDELILGDSFLRNVYSLFAYGPATSSATGTPPAYVQLLSVSCPVTLRLVVGKSL